MKLNTFIPDKNTSVFSYVWKIALVLLFIALLNFAFGLFGSVATVAKKEFGVETSLKKYEWFMNASSELRAKGFDIDLYQSKIDRLCSKEPINQNCYLYEQESFGLRSSYNSLVAEYNAAGKKFNWSLYNTQELQQTYTTK